MTISMLNISLNNVFAADDVISNNILNETRNKILITGDFPIIKINDNSYLQSIINYSLSSIFEDRISEAEKNGSTSITFEYTEDEDNDIYSVAIISRANNGITKERINSINFDTSIGKVLSISDILGENGVLLVNKYINHLIKKTPENYKSNFKTIEKDNDFYLRHGNIYILFDQNKISNKMITLEDDIFLSLENVFEIELGVNEYKTETDYGLKLVPLRKVAEMLGYDVNWNVDTKSVEVKKGDIITKIVAGTNSYSKASNISRVKGNNISVTRELETEPQYVKGAIYVPLSFFEVILNEVYTVTDDGKVIISSYQS
jgi:hypothetical protein